MKNLEKYKTSEERGEAFEEWCESNHEHGGAGSCLRLDSNCHACHFEWLDLEAEEEEKPLPCPYCGMELMTVVQDDVVGGYYVGCGSCQYRSPSYPTKHAVIVEHNRVARGAMNVNEEGEAK